MTSQTKERPLSGPGLLILTGASHTGKTSVAQAVLGSCPPPTAFLSVDNILADSLVRPSGDVWAEIPLVYELLLPQVEVLLDHGWLVILESTFTYVPSSGTPKFFDDALEQLIRVAERRRAFWLLAQLNTAEDVVRLRADRTGRLPADTVIQTVELHRGAAMPAPVLRLDADRATPEELAEQIVAKLRNLLATG